MVSDVLVMVRFSVNPNTNPKQYQFSHYPSKNGDQAKLFLSFITRPRPKRLGAES